MKLRFYRGRWSVTLPPEKVKRARFEKGDEIDVEFVRPGVLEIHKIEMVSE